MKLKSLPFEKAYHSQLYSYSLSPLSALSRSSSFYIYHWLHICALSSNRTDPVGFSCVRLQSNKLVYACVMYVSVYACMMYVSVPVQFLFFLPAPSALLFPLNPGSHQKDDSPDNVGLLKVSYWLKLGFLTAVACLGVNLRVSVKSPERILILSLYE